MPKSCRIPAGKEDRSSGKVLPLLLIELAFFFFFWSENIDSQGVGFVSVRSRWEGSENKERMSRVKDLPFLLCHIRINVIYTLLDLNCFHNLYLLPVS